MLQEASTPGRTESSQRVVRKASDDAKSTTMNVAAPDFRSQPAGTSFIEQARIQLQEAHSAAAPPAGQADKVANNVDTHTGKRTPRTSRMQFDKEGKAVHSKVIFNESVHPVPNKATLLTNLESQVVDVAKKRRRAQEKNNDDPYGCTKAGAAYLRGKPADPKVEHADADLEFFCKYVIFRVFGSLPRYLYDVMRGDLPFAEPRVERGQENSRGEKIKVQMYPDRPANTELPKVREIFDETPAGEYVLWQPIFYFGAKANRYVPPLDSTQIQDLGNLSEDKKSVAIVLDTTKRPRVEASSPVRNTWAMGLSGTWVTYGFEWEFWKPNDFLENFPGATRGNEIQWKYKGSPSDSSATHNSGEAAIMAWNRNKNDILYSNVGNVVPHWNGKSDSYWQNFYSMQREEVHDCDKGVDKEETYSWERVPLLRTFHLVEFPMIIHRSPQPSPSTLD